MAINTAPGEVYFIREKDLLTHEISNYVKIGLVREKDGRDSEERLLEHQTGNPRELFIEEIVKTSAVSAIEGLLHGLYAGHRVSGEWFDFDPEVLEACIEKTKTFANEARENLAVIELAAKLKDVVSTDEVKQPTEVITSYFDRYSRATACLGIVKGHQAVIKQLFVAAETEDIEVTHLVERQERKAPAKLDLDSLFRDHPEIQSKYSKLKTSITGRATFSKLSNENLSMDLLGPNIDEFLNNLEELTAEVTQGSKSVDVLQDASLRLTELETAAEWHQEISMANIKAYCGEAAEILGILKWKRTEKTEEYFDEKFFKESEPDLFEKYSSEGVTVIAHKVKQSKANPSKIN